MTKEYFKVQGKVVKEVIQRQHNKEYSVPPMKMEVGEEFKADPINKTSIRFYTAIKLYTYEPDFQYPFASHQLLMFNPNGRAFTRLPRRDLYSLALGILHYLNSNKQHFDNLDTKAETAFQGHLIGKQWESLIINNKNYLDLYEQSLHARKEDLLNPGADLRVMERLADIYLENDGRENPAAPFIKQAIDTIKGLQLKSPISRSDELDKFDKLDLAPSLTAADENTPGVDVGTSTDTSVDVHPSSPGYKCDYCDNTYSTPGARRSHVSRNHQGTHHKQVNQHA